MEYPRELVHRYGAKAGVLLYVAKQLPDIPQMAMVVNEPGESTDNFLKRADETLTRWPRLFRSSSVAELVGYEGTFPTETVDGFEKGYEQTKWNPHYWGIYRDREYFAQGLRYIIERIQDSPRRLKEDGSNPNLPEEMNVIVAEKASSKYSGTYIKHPNQEDYYLVSFTESASLDRDQIGYDPQRYFYTYHEGGTIAFNTSFTRFDHRHLPEISEDLASVISWHDRIASLPEMDPNWAYQIEFGINPPCLFQVRPFKPFSKADFIVKPPKYHISEEVVVIGVTSKEGLLARVETNIDTRNSDNVNSDNQPSVFYDELRTAWKVGDLRNHQANIFEHAEGLLAHGDISAMRHAQVSVLYANRVPTTLSLHLEQGDWVHIVSDGNNARIRNVSR